MYLSERMVIIFPIRRLVWFDQQILLLVSIYMVQQDSRGDMSHRIFERKDANPSTNVSVVASPREEDSGGNVFHFRFHR